MEDDWEEDIYFSAGEELGEEFETDEENRYISNLESGGGLYDVDDPDRLNFGIDPTDYGRFGTIGGEGVIEGKLGRIQRMNQDPYELALKDVNETINRSDYDIFEDFLKKGAVHIIEDLPRAYLPFYNTELIILSTLYISEYKKLNTKNLRNFLSKIKKINVNDLDVMRYIRMIESSKK